MSSTNDVDCGTLVLTGVIIEKLRGMRLRDKKASISNVEAIPIIELGHPEQLFSLVATRPHVV